MSLDAAAPCIATGSSFCFGGSVGVGQADCIAEREKPVERARREPKPPTRFTHPPADHDSSTLQRSKRKASKPDSGGIIKSKRPRHEFCEHQKLRQRCKDCKGTGICEHQRRREYCKDCKGSGMCEHNRQRQHCLDCLGSAICVHQRRRVRCYDCQRGDTAPAVWVGEARHKDPILHDVQLAVAKPPILVDV